MKLRVKLYKQRQHVEEAALTKSSQRVYSSQHCLAPLPADYLSLFLFVSLCLSLPPLFFSLCLLQISAYQGGKLSSILHRGASGHCSFFVVVFIPIHIFNYESPTSPYEGQVNGPDSKNLKSGQWQRLCSIQEFFTHLSWLPHAVLHLVLGTKDIKSLLKVTAATVSLIKSGSRKKQLKWECCLSRALQCQWVGWGFSPEGNIPASASAEPTKQKWELGRNK